MLFRQGFDKEKHKQQNKLRRLWRPAVATHPQMQANGIIADWVCYGRLRSYGETP